MQNDTIAKAFEDAMETADCETLIGHIQTWFDTPYRNPENALGIHPLHGFGDRHGVDEEGRRGSPQLAYGRSRSVAFGAPDD
jgi:hypothetical protein